VGRPLWWEVGCVVFSFFFLLGIASATFLMSEFHGSHEHILLHLFWRLPQSEGPGSCIYFPQEQGSPVNPMPGDITGLDFWRWSWSWSFTTDGQLASLAWCRVPIWSQWRRRLRVSWCVAPFLTRGWVRNLLVQLLMGLARAVNLGPKSRRAHDHIILSFETPPTWRARSPYLYPQEQGGPVIPLVTWFPFVASYYSQGYGGGV
jgi:hypothetical protein